MPRFSNPDRPRLRYTRRRNQRSEYDCGQHPGGCGRWWYSKKKGFNPPEQVCWNCHQRVESVENINRRERALEGRPDRSSSNSSGPSSSSRSSSSRRNRTRSSSGQSNNISQDSRNDQSSNRSDSRSRRRRRRSSSSRRSGDSRSNQRSDRFNCRDSPNSIISVEDDHNFLDIMVGYRCGYRAFYRTFNRRRGRDRRHRNSLGPSDPSFSHSRRRGTDRSIGSSRRFDINYGISNLRISDSSD